MFHSAAAPRRLLILCGLIPLPDLPQEEVDDLFRPAVTDAPESDPDGDEPASAG